MSDSSSEEDLSLFKSIAVEADAFSSRPSSDNQLASVKVKRFLPINDAVIKQPFQELKALQAYGVEDSEHASDGAELLPRGYQEKLWKALQQRLGDTVYLVEPRKRQREVPEAKNVEAEVDNEIRLFSKVKQGTAVTDSINQRKKSADGPGKKRQRKEREIKVIKKKDLRSVTVETESILAEAARLAERSRRYIGPPLQSLADPEPLKLHGIHLPSSLNGAGLPEGLRREVEDDNGFRQRGTYWKLQHTREKEEEAASRLKAQQSETRLQKKRHLLKPAKAKAGGGQRMAPRLRDRLVEQNAAAIFRSLVGSG